MRTVETPINNRSTIDVTMEEEAVLADEVIVTGYAATRKAAFTGSAQVVDSKLISRQTDANFMKALEGSVAGLQMFNVNGQPGGFASVNVRGVGSVNSGVEPLYVIDGMPMYSDKLTALSGEDNGDMAVSPLANINPADIESVTVLKDATATAIYGARAANGVIVITTKRGAQGKPHVNFLAKKVSPGLPIWIGIIVSSIRIAIWISGVVDSRTRVKLHRVRVSLWPKSMPMPTTAGRRG